MGLEAAAIAAAVIGTGVSIAQQKKGQQAQEESDAVGSAQQAIQNNRAIRQSIAASKIQRAQLIASGQAQTGGFGASSSVTGALGAAGTQLGANIGFARTIQASNTALNNQRSKFNQAAFIGGLGSTVASIPAQFGFDVRSSVRTIAGDPSKPLGTPAKTSAQLEFERLQGRGGRKFGTF